MSASAVSGLRSALLLEALNGGDLREIYRRLGTIDSSLRAYELVREGMAQIFLPEAERTVDGARVEVIRWQDLELRRQAMALVIRPSA